MNVDNSVDGLQLKRENGMSSLWETKGVRFDGRLIEGIRKGVFI
jgi:hypothetical protein